MVKKLYTRFLLTGLSLVEGVAAIVDVIRVEGVGGASVSNCVDKFVGITDAPCSLDLARLSFPELIRANPSPLSFLRADLNDFSAKSFTSSFPSSPLSRLACLAALRNIPARRERVFLRVCRDLFVRLGPVRRVCILVLLIVTNL